MSDGLASRREPYSVGFYLLIGAALLVFLQTFPLLSPIYLSFLLTVIISLALNPLVNRLRSLTGGRKGATGLIILVILASIAFVGWAFISPLVDAATNVSKVLPEYWERLQKPLIKMEQHAKRSEDRMQAEVTSERDSAQAEEGSRQSERETESNAADQSTSTPQDDSSSIRSSLAQMIRSVFGTFTRVAVNGAQVFVVLVTVFFGVIFTLLNPRPIVSAFFSLVPAHHHPEAEIIMRRICKFAPAWGGSTLAGMLCIGVLVFLLMWPLLGFSDALVLGLIAGLLESVPFLGPTLSTVPAVLLALGKGGMTPVWVLLAYVVIQALENNIILPVIMAQGMKLHAVAVIFSMLLCVSAFGVLGVLVAAPMVAIVSIIHEELYRKKFLPTVTDEDLDRLAARAMHEKAIASD